MNAHTGICRTVKRFGQTWLEEVARGTEGEFARFFEEYGASLAVLPIRISHLIHVGEGLEVALVPHDPKSWTWWGEFESDLEVRRRPRFGTRWDALHTQEEVRNWLRTTVQSYKAQLSRGAGAQPRSRQQTTEATGLPLADAHASLVAAVRGAFEEIETRYSCASIEVEMEHKCGGSMLRLNCSAPGTSKVSACVLVGEIDLYVGVDTRLEFVWARRRGPADVIDSVRAIIESVAEGRLEETVWEMRGEVIRSKAVVRLKDGNSLRSSRLSLFALPLIGRKRDIKYEPYA
jgi:ribosomal protein S5